MQRRCCTKDKSCDGEHAEESLREEKHVVIMKCLCRIAGIFVSLVSCFLISYSWYYLVTDVIIFIVSLKQGVLVMKLSDAPVFFHLVNM